MLFNSLQFWAFFAAVFALYLALPHRLQNRMLLVASYLFYAAWDWRFLSLILVSTAVDYVVGHRLAAAHDETRRRRLLAVSLSVNLGLLGVFKYLGFFVETFSDLLVSVGLSADPFTLSIILPVGISFYTFQTLSYTIDIHRRELAPTRDFFDFALFVAFFPQLVAGPIERARNLLPNITAPRRVTAEGVGRGVVLCLIGLVKKVVIADGIAPSVDAVYALDDAAGAEIVLATWLFAIQIYCDFSGYTDIARGVAKTLGFNLMRNFEQPYFASDPRAFWRRWHISLSTWLRDYLYVSLGGNRGGRARTMANLMATMTLGGLWHGAAWNFVLWGVYQGGVLAIHRAVGWGAPRHPLARALAAALFFQVVCYGWLLFRATSFAQIETFTLAIFSADLLAPGPLAMPTPPFPAQVGVAALLAWDLASERWGPQFYRVWPATVRAALYAALIYLLAFGAKTTPSSFIYFQF